MLSDCPRTFVDVGPSGTLCTFVKRLHAPESGSLALEAMNSFGHDSRCLDRVMHEATAEAAALANGVRADAEPECEV